MYVSEIISPINGKVINNKNVNKTFHNISINSKEVEENDIFIALIGKNFDGHNYIGEVIKNKPSAIIVSKDINIKTKIPIIKVDDTQEALINIGSFYRSKFLGKVIAVTGSAGKTMTKELIYNILNKKYKILKSEGNKNNHIGVPMTLTKLNNTYEFAILELGMNHKKEISNLSKLVKPDRSVITNIGTAHIGNLKSQKNIFKAKCEILDGMTNGQLVINKNDKYLKKIKSKKVEIVDTNLKVISVETNLKQTKFTINYNEKEYIFTLNVPGDYLIKNCLLAIRVGLIYNIPIEDIIDAIDEYKPLNNRLNVIEINDNIIIDDCYNSNYESVVSLLNYLKNIKQDKIIILGDILELGKYSKKIHKKIGKILSKNNFNHVLFVGNYMYFAHKKNKKSKYFKNNEELIEYLKNFKIEKSIILIKASRGMHLEEIVEYLKTVNKK